MPDRALFRRNAMSQSLSKRLGSSNRLGLSKRLRLALLTGLLLAGSSAPTLAQNVVPGGGMGPTPAPTPGQSTSIGPGNLGGGIGPAPAPTPGQSISIAPGNLGGGVGPAPAPTPGQSISLASNTRMRRGRVATPRIAPMPNQQIVEPPSEY